MLNSSVVKAETGCTAVEAAKLSFYRSAAAGAYTVPRVLWSDAERDIMVLERLSGYETLQRVYHRSQRDDQLALEVFAEAGRVLAHLHDHSSSQLPWVRALLPADPGVEQREDMLLLHGDFGFSNVWLQPDGRLAVLDPIPVWRDRSWPVSLGPPLHDLRIMMSCLIGRVSAGNAWRLPLLPRTELLKSFFSGYRAVRDPDCTFEQAVTSAAKYLSAYLAQRKGIPRIGHHILIKSLSPL